MTRQLFLCTALFGLFAVAVVWAQKADDVAGEMATGAKHLLGSLDAEQQKTATFPFADEERYNFHYIPRARLGMSYKDMEPGQRKVGLSLLASGLSRRGMSQALDIMYLEQILFELSKRPIRDPDAYFFTIFGTGTQELGVGVSKATTCRSTSLYATVASSRRRQPFGA